MLKEKPSWRFLGRFTLTHLLTYVAAGLLFMALSNYAEHFRSAELADFMRPVDDPVVALGIPMQIPRGLLLALAILPFRDVIVGSKHSWLKLWALLWVLTGIGAVITGPGSLEGMIYTRFGLGNPLIGFPEVTVQTMTFSWLLVKWERGAQNRI